MTVTSKNQFLAFIYFINSTFLTLWFVVMCPLYISNEQMILSTGIAGGKWAIQIAGAFFLLKEKRWMFIKNIGFVCFIGSCLLLPYIISSVARISNDARFFVGSLIVAVVAMILLYYRAVTKIEVKINWWFFWLMCLAIAVTLQLTVVFHAI